MAPTSVPRRFPCPRDFDADATLESLGGRQSNRACRHEELASALNEMRVVSHWHKPTPPAPKAGPGPVRAEVERDTLHDEDIDLSGR